MQRWGDRGKRCRDGEIEAGGQRRGDRGREVRAGRERQEVQSREREAGRCIDGEIEPGGQRWGDRGREARDGEIEGGRSETGR